MIDEQSQGATLALRTFLLLMEKKQLGLGHVTLVCLAVGLCHTVVGADNEKTKEYIPEEVCFLDDVMRKHLNCTPGTKSALGDKYYVDEEAYCSHDLKTQCLTCIDGTMEEMPCLDPIKERQKRWWWGRRGRRSSGPPPNSAPRITCPAIGSSFTAPPGSLTVVVTWGKPSTSDNEGNIRSTTLISKKSPGSSFREGFHTVSYRVTDAGGLSATCSRTFTVRVIRCTSPSGISQGAVQCHTTVGVVFGTKCTYTCNPGWEISGSATITCQRNGAFTASPTCQKIACGTPPVPQNAKSVSCTDGHLYRSVCSPLCSKGYRTGRNARLICGANKKWSSISFFCEDTVKPVFTSCPTKKINTIDRRYKWTVTATDNSGKVTLKQFQGQAPGSLLNYGVHFIKYVATDASGNSASCAFAVEMKERDCPRPTSNDTDVKFTCNGLTAGSYCQISCKSKSSVEGSKYIACVQDKSQNNTSYWEPVHGLMGTCNKGTCPPLNTPKNGALACDKQRGGTICQIQCNVDYEVSYSDQRFHTFVCGKDSDTWNPKNTVPDCLELAFPDEYYLPTDFYYFTGDCSDPQALNDIKQQFIDNLNSIGISPCMTDVCSVDDIQVDCGDMMEPTDFRRRRSINQAKRVLHVRVRFHVKNTNRTLSPSAAGTLLKSLVDKSKNVMSTNTAMRTMLSKALTPSPKTKTMFRTGWRYGRRRVYKVAYVTPVVVKQVKAKSVAGEMSIKCTAGQAQTEAGVCVPCAIGTFSDAKSQTCKSCAVTTYQDQSAMTSCRACPSHHAALSPGATARDQCKKQCGPDTFSPTGLVPCFPCPDGRYQTQYGSKTCQLCPKSPGAGQVPQKCLQTAKTSSNSTTLQISNFLLTCGSETCLSF